MRFTGNNAGVYNTHINAMTSQVLNTKTNFFGSSNYYIDGATSASFDFIVLTNLAIEFYNTEPINSLSKRKYWTLGGGTPYRLFTNSDGTSTGVLYMVFKWMGESNRCLWLMDITKYSAAMHTIARYGSTRKMHWSGSQRDLESIEGFGSQYAIALAKVGTEAWIGRFQGVNSGGPSTNPATHEWSVKLQISNNISYRWTKGTTQVIIVSVNQK